MKTILMIVCASVLAWTLPAQEKNFIDQNYIEVNGRAEVQAAPDEIYLSITLNEQASKGKVSLASQEKEMFKSLKGLNLDLEKNMVVQDQSADYQTFLLRKNAVLTSKTYQLKVSSAAQMSAVFGALAAIDVSDVNVIRTDVSNIDELRQQVRGAAAKAAQQNAQVLASAVGRKVGSAIYIQDLSYSPRPFVSVMMAKSSVMMDNAAAEAAPQLEFEKIRIEHSVTIRFAME